MANESRDRGTETRRDSGSTRKNLRQIVNELRERGEPVDRLQIELVSPRSIEKQAS